MSDSTVSVPVRQLPNRTYAPPGGWRYTVPETGQRFRGVSDYQLKCELEAHYRANQLQIPSDLDARIEQFVCEQEPDYCTDAHGQPVRDGRRSFVHEITTVLQGTRTLFAWMAGGRQLVDASLSERRASVCVACPMNQEPEGCTSCNAKTTREVVTQIVGTRQTSLHNQLKACKVCSCWLAAKVQLPHAVLWNHMPPALKEQLPASCWLVTEQPPST